MAWCPQDPDLLLSCGKDNRILCWNPNAQAAGGEVRSTHFFPCMLKNESQHVICFLMVNVSYFIMYAFLN